MRSCAQRRKLSSVAGQLQKKARSPLHNMGSTLRSDHLSVSRVCNDGHFVRSCSRFVTRTFRASTSQQVSPRHHPDMERMRKRQLDRAKQIYFSSHDRIVSQLPSFLSRVKYLGKMSNCHHTCFSRWSHHVHNRSAVWDGVGKCTPQDLIRSCDECCAI